MPWRHLLDGTRGSHLFGVSVLKNAPAALAAPVAAWKPHVDQSKMAVTAILTTGNADRQGDIIDPTGGDFSEHRTNPVVMFHHGKTHKLPIGKAEDANGNYTVQLVHSADGPVLVGTTHFAQSNRFAQDVFGLVAEDVLRGVSIGFDPLTDSDSVDELGPSPTLKRPALHFKGWKLLEYSHTPIGVNRDALTVAVQKALDGSRKLDPRLLSMLQPMTAPRKTVVSASDAKTNPAGTVEKGCAGMSKRQAAVVAAKKKTKKPAARKAMDDDEDTDDVGAAGSPDDDNDADMADQDDGDPGASGDDDFDPAADDPSTDPALAGTSAGQYGAADEPPPPTVQTLTDGAQGLLDLCSAIEGGMKRSEHMKGRKYAAKVCADLRKMSSEVKTFADKVHAELASGLAPSPDADDGEGDDEETDAADVAPGDDGDDSNPEPETDEDGALVTKGGWAPRRFTFADLPGGTAPGAKSRPAPAPTDRKYKALEREHEELKRAFERLLEDVEAGNRR